MTPNILNSVMNSVEKAMDRPSSVAIATDARTSVLRRAWRELGLIAVAEADPKVREGIDRAVQHLKSMEG